MQQMPLIPRRRPFRGSIFAFAVVSMFFALVAVAQNREAGDQNAEPPVEQSPDSESVSGVYLPSDRTLSRAMTRARDRLGEREFHQSLTFLQEMLSKEEDTFLDQWDGPADRLGLKATARRLIGELPTEGRDAYELLHGATARRQLEAALTSGDQDGLAQVVRQFYHTTAGYEAALVLAQLEADRGHHLAAAQLYQELLDAPQAAAQFEPQLSVMAAINHLAAGEPELATSALKALAERSPGVKLELGGQQSTLPAADADLIAWLSQFVGQPLAPTRAEANWLTAHGDPSRNAQYPGGPPHLRARWQARVINEPNAETYLSDKARLLNQRGVAAMPGARPLAVGDIVLMRTPQNIVAVDWQSGKRIWETRDDDGLDSDQLRASLTSEREEEASDGGINPLDQRIWDDTLASSLSSDGKRVFVVRGLTVSNQEESQAIQVVPGFGGGMISATQTTNQLTAFDLETQGKLIWELDGSRAEGPLAGAFFLGTPLAIDNTLFVMAEIRSAVYLLALAPQSGELRWQQQLVGLEQGIGLDPIRRLAGSAPSYAGGILVCPTGAGAVVAVDVVKREFVWVYRYPRDASSLAGFRNLWQQPDQNHPPRASAKWQDNSVIIAEGKVFLTPPESAEMFCLDLRTGALAWKHRASDALFAGCVNHGFVLLIGTDAVEALRVNDGTPAWKDESIPLPSGVLPAGQGYLSEDHYYLPLTNGEVAAIDVAAGKLDAPIAGEHAMPLGNLICYRGTILSQSALVLDKFEQSNVLRHRAVAALAKNPDDAEALRELAEMKRVDGDRAEAVRLLKRAYELAPNDVLTQETLAECLLEALGADFVAFRDDVPILRALCRSREQELALLRIETLGLDSLKDRLAAFDSYLRLVDATTDEPAYLQVDDKYGVRSDRWIRGRLGALWAEASPAERESLAAKLESRRPVLLGTPDTTSLARYLAHYDQLPGAGAIRLQLARSLVDGQHFQEAELELLQLATAADTESQAAVAVLMTKLLAFSKHPEEAAPFATKLATKWKEVVTLDGLTGGQWLERFARELADASETYKWPSGAVAAKFDQSGMPGGARADTINRSENEQQSSFRLLRIEQDSVPNASAMQWLVTNDGSGLIGRSASGSNVFRWGSERDNSWLRQNNDSSFVHGARLGHLLIVSLGGQIVALDARSGETSEGEALWQAYPLGRFSTALRRGSRSPTRRRDLVYYSSSDRKRATLMAGAVIGALGPATPLGVVFQEQETLRCVDPVSGETLWERTDIPTGCELFGDQELVFAADVEKQIAYVVRMIDGRLLGQRELPEVPWMMTSGRNVAKIGFNTVRDKRSVFLRVTDIWAKKELFSAEYVIDARLASVEPTAVAIYEPSGKFQLLDVGTGKLIIDQQLAPLPKPRSIETLLSGNQLFVMISNQGPQQEHLPVLRPDYPIVNGLVYAFDKNSGEPLWPSPAVVRDRGIALAQPIDLPVLVFVDREMKRDTGGGGSKLRLLCLDKNTGQAVYRNDNLPDTAGGRFRIRSERDGGDKVYVEMSAGEVQLALSDEPRPPQPPANDDLESSRKIVDRGLWGVGKRMTNVLQDALETPAEKNSPLNNGNEGANAPAVKNGNEPIDDD